MSKEATIFAIDLGPTMAGCNSGRTETDLDYGLRYVYNKMADYMSTDRKTLFTGVIGFRTDETDNPLADDGYENISVIQPMVNLTIDEFRELRSKMKTNNAPGDAISAIVVAMEIMTKYTNLKTGKPGSYTRRIIVVTDGQGIMEDAQLDEIASEVKRRNIDVTIVGIDFDDAEFGFKEEDKPPVKKENEELLRSFIEKCDNDSKIATAAEVIESLSMPSIKAIKPVQSFRDGKLWLGDFEKYPESAVCIEVQRFPRTRIAKPPTASSFAAQSKTRNGESPTQSTGTVQGDTEMVDAPSSDLAGVKSGTKYSVNDPTMGTKEILRQDLARAYHYGSTVVPISESEENVTKMDTFQSCTIIGFVPSDNYEKYFTMGESNVILALQINDKARIAFSSFVHALYELDTYAVARMVQKSGSEPQIVLLAAHIEIDVEALLEVPLPFAEDVRMYRFPPLDRVITASGARLEKHRYLPSSALDAAMSGYVDSMDLSTFGKDEKGNPKEYMEIEETYSPIVHHIKGAIRHRAIYNDSIEDPSDVLMQWSEPPKELISASASLADTLVAAADVKKVPPKAKGKRQREVIKPLSGLNIQDLLKGKKKQKISKENAIPDFKQAVDEPENDEVVFDAIKQMSAIIRDLLKSTGDTGVDRAKENIRVMRHELTTLEFPKLYNDFLRDLKNRVTKEEFGDRRLFWRGLTYAKLGLIDTSITPNSDVSPEEAEEFLALTTELPSRGRGG